MALPSQYAACVSSASSEQGNMHWPDVALLERPLNMPFIAWGLCGRWWLRTPTDTDTRHGFSLRGELATKTGWKKAHVQPDLLCRAATADRIPATRACLLLQCCHGRPAPYIHYTTAFCNCIASRQCSCRPCRAHHDTFAAPNTWLRAAPHLPPAQHCHDVQSVSTCV